jgi:hypothetical protein
MKYPIVAKYLGGDEERFAATSASEAYEHALSKRTAKGRGLVEMLVHTNAPGVWAKFGRQCSLERKVRV